MEENSIMEVEKKTRARRVTSLIDSVDQDSEEAIPEVVAREVLTLDTSKFENSEVNAKKNARLIARKQDLKNKLPAVLDRYKAAYGVSLTKGMLQEYIKDCAQREIFDFLEGRLGRLFAVDREIMAEILQEI